MAAFDVTLTTLIILSTFLTLTIVNCQYNNVVNNNNRNIPERHDYGADLTRPNDPKTARSILGYSIYDAKPVTNMKAIDFEDHWRQISDVELNPEFYGYKFGERIK